MALDVLVLLAVPRLDGQLERLEQLEDIDEEVDDAFTILLILLIVLEFDEQPH